LVAPDERQYTVILLDADDTFDVIIHSPDGSREAVWSLMRDPDAPGVAVCPACGETTLDYDAERHVYVCPECEEEFTQL
jgi:hypothetical protein